MIIIYYILVFFQLVILARVLLSWFPNVDRYNPIIRFIYDVTEPVLRPVRNALAGVLPRDFPIDLSSLAVLLAISLLMRIIF